MSKKALTRFYARHSGFNAELFAVRENTNGDLTIKHRPIFYERRPFAYFDQKEVSEEKYSVHVSPNSSGHTITHTIGFTDGTEDRKAWFIECGDFQFLTPLYSRRHTSLIERLFKMNARMKDHRVRVAEFDITKNSLITHVFVGGRDSRMTDKIPFDIISHHFRLFTVHVVKAFVPFQSIEQGCHNEPRDGSSLPTLSVEGAQTYIDQSNAALCRTFFPRAMTEIMNAMGDEIRKIPIGVVDNGPLTDRLTELHRATRIERFPL